MRMFLDTERNLMISEEEIRFDWDDMTEEEQAEYQFSFGKYLNCCMTSQGGTLEEIRDFNK